MSKYFLSLVGLLGLAFSSHLAAEDARNSSVKISASAEFGFTAFLQNDITFGKGNDNFSYVKQGAHDVLFSNWRGQVGIEFLGDHSFTLLYQPIYPSSETIIQDDVQFGNAKFGAGDPINLDYYFPFYRLTYLYRFYSKHNINMFVGGGVQIRNTTIRFFSPSSNKRFETTDVGPVPVISFSIDIEPVKNLVLALDSGGFWAPIKFLNGGNVDVNAWIYDVGLQIRYRTGYHLAPYLSARIVGGGAVGTSSNPRSNYDGYTSNELITMNATTGLRIEF